MQLLGQVETKIWRFADIQGTEVRPVPALFILNFDLGPRSTYNTSGETLIVVEFNALPLIGTLGCDYTVLDKTYTTFASFGARNSLTFFGAIFGALMTRVNFQICKNAHTRHGSQHFPLFVESKELVL